MKIKWDLVLHVAIGAALVLIGAMLYTKYTTPELPEEVITE